MRTRIASLVAALAFVFICANVLGSFNSWECTCIHNECDWCGDRDEQEWSEFHADAFDEYADEFTALFNSYTYKLSKNGRSMVNGKFVKKGN